MKTVVGDTIAAGGDTIAITVLWSIVILTHYQDVQEKLRNEVDEFIKVYGRLPTFDERDHLPHLISVQKECMRYRSTLPFGLLHETSKDCMFIMAHFIRKALIICRFSGMQRLLYTQRHHCCQQHASHAYEPGCLQKP